MTPLVDNSSADNSDGSTTSTDDGVKRAVPSSSSTKAASELEDVNNSASRREAEQSSLSDDASSIAAAVGGVASWSAVARGGERLPTSSGQSPAGSMGNLLSAAISPSAQAADKTSASSWKNKLQQNMTVQVPQSQQQQHRQGGSMRSGGGASPATSNGGAGQSQPKSPAVSSQAPVVRPGASSRTSAGLSAEISPRAPPGALRALPGGRYAFIPAAIAPEEAANAASQAMPLVRGLLNSDADNNCFLNVIIQSLWHLECFRLPMLQTSFSTLETRAAAPADKRVMAAVWRVFRAMAADAPPIRDSVPSSEAAVQLAADVSPRELRAALVGQSSIHVDPSDMHDAGEVFGEILGMLHRAEAVKPPASAVAPSAAVAAKGAAVSDLQLPRKVKIAAPRPPSTEGSSPPAAPSPYAAALLSGVPAASGGGDGSGQQRPSTLVHRIFGLDVQIPCPASDEEGDSAPRSGSKGGRRSPPLTAPIAIPYKDSSVVEVQQFTKVSHNQTCTSQSISLSCEIVSVPDTNAYLPLPCSSSTWWRLRA